MAAALPSAASLALVPGLAGPGDQAGRPLRAVRLPGGTVNETWRIDTPEGRFVLRLDGPAWRRPGVDRPRERLLHQAAAAAGLAPRVVAADLSAGVLVCEYVEGRIWAAHDLSGAAQLDRLGERLARLHALEPPHGAGRFDPQACAAQYLELAGDAAAAGGAPELLAGLRAAVLEIEAAGAEPRIIHGDLVHGNLIEGDRLWLLDWEYAQLSDPLYDVACVLAYYPLARPHAARLLAAAGLEGRARERLLRAAAYVYEALTWAWHRARGEQAAHPGRFPP